VFRKMIGWGSQMNSSSFLSRYHLVWQLPSAASLQLVDFDWLKVVAENAGYVNPVFNLKPGCIFICFTKSAKVAHDQQQLSDALSTKYRGTQLTPEAANQMWLSSP
jgi:hypothetical protein